MHTALEETAAIRQYDRFVQNMAKEGVIKFPRKEKPQHKKSAKGPPEDASIDKHKKRIASLSSRLSATKIRTVGMNPNAQGGE